MMSMQEGEGQLRPEQKIQNIWSCLLKPHSRQLQTPIFADEAKPPFFF